MTCVGNKCFSSVAKRTQSPSFIQEKLAEAEAQRKATTTVEKIEAIIKNADTKRLANPKVKFNGRGGLADQAKVHLDALHLYLQQGAISESQKKEYAAKLKSIVLAV